MGQRASDASAAFARVGTAVPAVPAALSEAGSGLAVIEPTTVVSPPVALETSQLSDTERADLAAYEAAYEAAVDEGRRAAWAAGEALQLIRDNYLYRPYAKFEDYTRARWGLSHSQVYRLIDAWELGRRLSPIGERFGVKVVESHIRELVPLVRQEGLGPDAAEAAFLAVAQTGQVTAKVLRMQASARLTGMNAATMPQPADPVRKIIADMHKFADKVGRDAVDQMEVRIMAALADIKREAGQ